MIMLFYVWSLGRVQSRMFSLREKILKVVVVGRDCRIGHNSVGRLRAYPSPPRIFFLCFGPSECGYEAFSEVLVGVV